MGTAGASPMCHVQAPERRQSATVKMINDPDFISHVAKRAGVSLAVVRYTLQKAAALGLLEPTGAGECQCRDCLGLGPADE
jgi:hypothetical protein